MKKVSLCLCLIWPSKVISFYPKNKGYQKPNGIRGGGRYVPGTLWYAYYINFFSTIMEPVQIKSGVYNVAYLRKFTKSVGKHIKMGRGEGNIKAVEFVEYNITWKKGKAIS